MRYGAFAQSHSSKVSDGRWPGSEVYTMLTQGIRKCTVLTDVFIAQMQHEQSARQGCVSAYERQYTLLSYEPDPPDHWDHWDALTGADSPTWR